MNVKSRIATVTAVAAVGALAASMAIGRRHRASPHRRRRIAAAASSRRPPRRPIPPRPRCPRTTWRCRGEITSRTCRARARPWSATRSPASGCSPSGRSGRTSSSRCRRRPTIGRSSSAPTRTRSPRHSVGHRVVPGPCHARRQVPRHGAQAAHPRAGEGRLGRGDRPVTQWKASRRARLAPGRPIRRRDRCGCASTRSPPGRSCARGRACPTRPQAATPRSPGPTAGASWRSGTPSR